NSTISGNRPNGGVGGIDNQGGSTSAVNVKNSIIAGNGNIGSQAVGFSSDLNGTFISQGYNLIGTSGARDTGFTNNVNNDQVGSSATPLDPKLGPLQNNGGSTFTHALLPGSPAIDQGSAATGGKADQRGLPRPDDDPFIPNASGGDGSDIGAFEVQAPTPTPTPTPTPLVCSMGFADCNGNPADGCEINWLTDNENCGSCGRSCSAGTHCSNGGCVANTPSPTPTPIPTCVNVAVP